MEKNRWVKVSLETAQRHPLYGVDGWLLAFAILNMIGLWLLVMQFFKMLDKPLDFEAAVCIVSLLAHAIMLSLLFLKIKYFRVFTISVFFLGSAYGLFDLVLSHYSWNNSSFGTMGYYVSGAFAVYILITLFFIAYLLLSKRIRVTCEHCVHRSDPFLQKEEEREPDRDHFFMAGTVLEGTENSAQGKHPGVRIE